jgi:hypothetical protein
MTQEKSIINAPIIIQIEDYMYNKGVLNFKLKGFVEEITVYYFSFPNSFDDPHSRRQLKNVKLNSFYELMNVLYKKLDIDEVDLTSIQEGDEYCYLQIEYFTKPSSQTASVFRHEKHSFIITQTGDPEIIKIAYHKGNYVDYVKFTMNIDAVNLENEIHQEAIQNLEKIIYGICNKINIEIPKEIEVSKFENLVINTPDIKDFIKLLQLVTRNLFDDSAYKKDAKRLQTFHKKGKDEMEMHEKFRAIVGEYYLTENEVCVQDATFFSDWKFDPEDIEAGITSILRTEFAFAYPPETYSADLFPYLQTELAKQNLELMNADTFGDSYLFFIANKNEVERILELSQTIGIKVDRLM